VKLARLAGAATAPRSGSPLAQYPRGLDRCGKALDLDRPEVLVKSKSPPVSRRVLAAITTVPGAAEVDSSCQPSPTGRIKRRTPPTIFSSMRARLGAHRRNLTPCVVISVANGIVCRRHTFPSGCNMLPGLETHEGRVFRLFVAMGTEIGTSGFPCCTPVRRVPYITKPRAGRPTRVPINEPQT
jgi:hypothetical protein